MLRKLVIKNFKSIEHLQLELGRVNVFIGENGCGKTNILEALGMAAAAASSALDTASLKGRGIRVADPAWMRSGFTTSPRPEPITLVTSSSATESPAMFIARLAHDITPFGQWRNRVVHELGEAFTQDPTSDFLDDSSRQALRDAIRQSPSEAAGLSAAHGLPRLTDLDLQKDGPLRQVAMAAMFQLGASRLKLPTFLCYLPREDALRDLARDSDLEPIGIHGEGLFRLLQVLDSEGMLPAIKEQLGVFGWFEDLTLASGVNPSTRALNLHDVFIDGARPFDQRSANEGLLFVLLYTCLLVSKYTPAFFAVDNVDTALNPKLCAGVVQMFARLTKQYDKQVILTTHNPGALDGLDLNDDEQRLFVIYRDIEGKTCARRISRPNLPEDQTLRLSEALLRGYLGALPNL